jgi:hypothetical protein
VRLHRLGDAARQHAAYKRALKLLNEIYRKEKLGRRLAVLQAAGWLVDLLENLTITLGADHQRKHGYPASANTAEINYVMAVILPSILVIYVTLLYAPIAAWLVELFPTRIHDSGLSLPYHIGNGWAGHGICHRRSNRQHLFRTLVSDLWWRQLVLLSA